MVRIISYHLLLPQPGSPPTLAQVAELQVPPAMRNYPPSHKLDHPPHRTRRLPFMKNREVDGIRSSSVGSRCPFMEIRLEYVVRLQAEIEKEKKSEERRDGRWSQYDRGGFLGRADSELERGPTNSFGLCGDDRFCAWCAFGAPQTD